MESFRLRRRGVQILRRPRHTAAPSRRGGWLALSKPSFGGDSAGLGDLARCLYVDSPQYLRVLNDASDAFGDDVAVELLPRFCTLAFQYADPGKALADLIALTRDSNSAPRVLQLTPFELCQWAHAAPSAVAKSLRERGDLKGNAWFRMLDPYLDDFEQTRSVEGRLALMMSKTGVPIFLPMCTAFRDGEVVTRRVTGTDREREHFLSCWADATARLYDGLDCLA